MQRQSASINMKENNIEFRVDDKLRYRELNKNLASRIKDSLGGSIDLDLIDFSKYITSANPLSIELLSYYDRIFMLLFVDEDAYFKNVGLMHKEIIKFIHKNSLYLEWTELLWHFTGGLLSKPFIPICQAYYNFMLTTWFYMNNSYQMSSVGLIENKRKWITISPPTPVRDSKIYLNHAVTTGKITAQQYSIVTDSLQEKYDIDKEDGYELEFLNFMSESVYYYTENNRFMLPSVKKGKFVPILLGSGYAKAHIDVTPGAESGIYLPPSGVRVTFLLFKKDNIDYVDLYEDITRNGERIILYKVVYKSGTQAGGIFFIDRKDDFKHISGDVDGTSDFHKFVKELYLDLTNNLPTDNSSRIKLKRVENGSILFAFDLNEIESSDTLALVQYSTLNKKEAPLLFTNKEPGWTGYKVTPMHWSLPQK